MEIFCFSCNKTYEIDESRAVARSETCPLCGAPTRCCKMCDFYDPTTYNECREPMAEKVVEKDKSNFCNYYRVRKGKNNWYDDNRQSIFNAADALFKKKS